MKNIEIITPYNYTKTYRLRDDILKHLNNGKYEYTLFDDRFVDPSEERLLINSIMALKMNLYIEKQNPKTAKITKKGEDFINAGGYHDLIVYADEEIVYTYLAKSMTTFFMDSEFTSTTGMDLITFRDIIDDLKPGLIMHASNEPPGQYEIRCTDGADAYFKAALESGNFDKLKRRPAYNPPQYFDNSKHYHNVSGIQIIDNVQSFGKSNLKINAQANTPTINPNKKESKSLSWGNIWAVVAIIVSIAIAIITWVYFT